MLARLDGRSAVPLGRRVDERVGDDRRCWHMQGGDANLSFD